MSDIMADIALALIRGSDLVESCGHTFANDGQRKYEYDIIYIRIREDFCNIMQKHSDTIEKVVGGVYTQYKNGLILDTECIFKYLVRSLSNVEERESALALHSFFVKLERNLREIYYPDTSFGKGCLLFFH